MKGCAVITNRARPSTRQPGKKRNRCVCANQGRTSRTGASRRKEKATRSAASWNGHRRRETKGARGNPRKCCAARHGRLCSRQMERRLAALVDRGQTGRQVGYRTAGEKAGQFDLLVVLTKARDYGIVQIWLDDKKLGMPVDLYNNPRSSPQDC